MSTHSEESTQSETGGSTGAAGLMSFRGAHSQYES